MGFCFVRSEGSGCIVRVSVLARVRSRGIHYGASCTSSVEGISVNALRLYVCFLTGPVKTVLLSDIGKVYVFSKELYNICEFFDIVVVRCCSTA